MVQDAGHGTEPDVRTTPAAAAEAPSAGATAVSARKPGLVGRLLNGVQGTFAGITAPRWDWRTFACGLIALIALVWLIQNWAPWRVTFFGWHLDLPMAVWFVIFVALGVLLARLWRGQRRRDDDDDLDLE